MISFSCHFFLLLHLLKDAEPVIEHVKTDWENCLDFTSALGWTVIGGVGSSANNDHCLALALGKMRDESRKEVGPPKDFGNILVLSAVSYYLLPHTHTRTVLVEPPFQAAIDQNNCWCLR